MARHRHARLDNDTTSTVLALTRVEHARLDNDTASAVLALTRVERTCKALTEMLVAGRARAVYTGPKHPSARLSADHYGFSVVQ